MLEGRKARLVKLGHTEREELQCPRCRSRNVHRRRLPAPYRPLRWFVSSIRAYRCYSCEHGFLGRR